MPGNPYNNQNPNANFYSMFATKETFQNKQTPIVTTKSNNVTVDDIEFRVGEKKLTRVCPHNGCLLNYNQEKQKFVCPCHSSTFNLKGDCLSGPACPKDIRIN